MSLGGVIDPQARHRVVARQHHHLHASLLWRVKCHELLHQTKSHPRVRWCVEAIPLQLHVGPVVALFKDSVFLLEIKQGSRGNGHHQLIGCGLGHWVLNV